MSMSASDIAHHPDILDLIRLQCRGMQAAYSSDQRLSSVFATQQRWLLAHAALRLYFLSALEGRPMLTLARYLETVAEHAIASPNTADSMIKEMIHYGYLLPIAVPGDRRARPMQLADKALLAFGGWVVLHLATLDRLNGGARLAAFTARPDLLAPLEIGIAEGLLTHPLIRQPQDTFSLFTWLNNGGVIMDWLVSGLGPVSADGTRHATAVASIAEMVDWTRLSRTHLARKLREAEAMGSLGWTGKRGLSPMWVSSGFVGEIVGAQAVKLAVIDAACQAAGLR